MEAPRAKWISKQCSCAPFAPKESPVSATQSDITTDEVQVPLGRPFGARFFRKGADVMLLTSSRKRRKLVNTIAVTASWSELGIFRLTHSAKIKKNGKLMKFDGKPQEFFSPLKCKLPHCFAKLLLNWLQLHWSVEKLLFQICVVVAALGCGADWSCRWFIQCCEWISDDTSYCRLFEISVVCSFLCIIMQDAVTDAAQFVTAGGRCLASLRILFRLEESYSRSTTLSI